jgi:hypothetical protein
MKEELKDILHREKLKKISEEKVEVIPSWENKYDKLAQMLGYEDMMHDTFRNPMNITDWKQKRKLETEEEMNEWRYFQLGRVKKMLLIGWLYPFFIVLLLCLIYIS